MFSLKYLFAIFILILLIGGLVYPATLTARTANNGNDSTAVEPYQVKIKLPSQFIELVNNASIKLSDNIRLMGCEKARLRHKKKLEFYRKILEGIYKNLCNFKYITDFATILLSSPQTDTFVAECDNPPTALMINGFKPIYDFKSENQAQTITFTPTKLITEVKISADQTYYFNNTRLQQTRVVVDKGTLPLSYQDIGRDLHFRSQLFSSPPCEIIKHISMAEVMQNQQNRLSLTCKALQGLEKTIHYHEDYAIYQFPTQSDCHAFVNGTLLGRYTPIPVNEINLAHHTNLSPLFLPIER